MATTVILSIEASKEKESQIIMLQMCNLMPVYELICHKRHVLYVRKANLVQNAQPFICTKQFSVCLCLSHYSEKFRDLSTICRWLFTQKLQQLTVSSK